MPDPTLIDSLFPADLPDIHHWLAAYPPRDLPPGAMVTRFAPSPTGHLHIGGVYTAMICHDLAAQSGGRYFLRIEDTDQARLVPGAAAQFDHALRHFGLTPDEDDTDGRYGPYTQSARARIYLSFVRHLLRTGHAYLCFATKPELAELAAAQKAAKVPTGYYRPWAPWRDAPDNAVSDALAAGRPYVVRFRCPGTPGDRFAFTDAIRGRIESDDNINDVVLLKSSADRLRLPTYHLAHVVDDTLMRVTLVLRGDEWLSSVPLHHQLFTALGLPPVQYAHIAPLLKIDGRSRRKLSKRQDPEASVDFYLQAGYPVPPLLHYLRGLANGRLADLPGRQALATPIRLADCGASGALLDLTKLDDMCADHIATLTGEQILDQVTGWARRYDPQLAETLAAHPTIALNALAIERDGTANPRKDLRRWSQFRPVYGYFLPALFQPVTSLVGTKLGHIDDTTAAAFAADLAASYMEHADPDRWFDQIRQAAAAHGFAATVGQYQADRDRYVGSIRDAAQIVRLTLTGSLTSPALHAVASVLGHDQVTARLRALQVNRPSTASDAI